LPHALLKDRITWSLSLSQALESFSVVS